MEQIYHSSFGYQKKYCLSKSTSSNYNSHPNLLKLPIVRRLHGYKAKVTIFKHENVIRQDTKITCFIKNYIKSTSIPAISRTWYVQTRGKENKHCRIAGTKKKVHLTITKAKIVGPRLKRNSNQNIILFVWKTGTDFGLFPKFQRPNQFS